MLKELVLKNRSYRCFDENHHIDINLLKEFIEIARHTPSAANLQPVNYYISNTPETNTLIFQSVL